MKGKVKIIKKREKYGFITPEEGGEAVFFHFRDIKKGWINVGDKVKFKKVSTKRKHPRARNVVKIESPIHYLQNKWVIIPLVGMATISILIWINDPKIWVLSYPISLVGGIYLDWKIFKKISKIELYNDAKLFGAFLLATIMAIIGVLLVWSVMFSSIVFGMGTVSELYFPFFGFLDPLYPVYYQIYHSLGLYALQSFQLFVFIFGFALLIIGAYLYFRFMRRAGILIFPG